MTLMRDSDYGTPASNASETVNVTIDGHPVEVPAGRAWAELPYEWNPHARDSRGVAGCRFFHATCFPDRKAAMIEAIS